MPVGVDSGPEIAWSWGHPERLLGLVGVALLVLWYLGNRRRLNRDRAALGLSEPNSNGTETRAPWLRFLALTALVLALAQPRWGHRNAPTEGSRNGPDLVLAVDVSRSMGAEDAVPDRLGVAREAANGLLAALKDEPGARAGLVAFAGRAVVRCPLTPDLDAVADALRELRPGSVRPGGTDLGEALRAATELFGTEDADPSSPADRVVLLFSDGEDHLGNWPDAASEAARAGIAVHTIALGDPERAQPVPVIGPDRVRTELTYRGAPVRSRRRDEPLQAIARSTGGAFLPLGLASVDLGAIYRQRLAPAAGRRINRMTREGTTAAPAERFGWLLSMALVGLALSVRPRRWRRAAWVVPLAWTLGAAPTDPASEVANGLAAYRAERWTEALTHFEHAAAAASRNAESHFNLAAALYRLGRYDEAGRHYLQARELVRNDPLLVAKIRYALGNVALAQGKVRESITHYDECLNSSSADAALREDARINRDFARSLLDSHQPDTERDRGSARSDEPKSARSGTQEPEPEPEPGKNSGQSSREPAAPGEGDGSSPPGTDKTGGGGGAGRLGAGAPGRRLDRALDLVRRHRDDRLPESSRPVDPSVPDW